MPIAALLSTDHTTMNFSTIFNTPGTLVTVWINIVGSVHLHQLMSHWQCRVGRQRKVSAHKENGCTRGQYSALCARHSHCKRGLSGLVSTFKNDKNLELKVVVFLHVMRIKFRSKSSTSLSLRCWCESEFQTDWINRKVLCYCKLCKFTSFRISYKCEDMQGRAQLDYMCPSCWMCLHYVNVTNYEFLTLPVITDTTLAGCSKWRDK